MDAYGIGQRVMLAPGASVSVTVRTLHADDPGTVVRRVERQGRRNYLVQFDRTDAVFGLYWLEQEQLDSLDAGSKEKSRSASAGHA